jgi:hypothetical protein
VLGRWVLSPLVVVLVTAVPLVHSAAAQQDCVSCSGYAVSVTPDGGTVSHPENTNGWQDLNFLVQNTGT